VAEGINEAWQGKLLQRYRTECARIKKMNQRNQTDVPKPTYDEWRASTLSQGQSGDNNVMSLETGENVPRDKSKTSEIVTRDNAGTCHPIERDRERDRKNTTTARAREEMDDLEKRLREAAGAAIDPKAREISELAHPLAWTLDGCDLELDILPTIRLVSNRLPAGKIRSWRYFEEAVKAAKIFRTNPNEGHSHVGKPKRTRGTGTGRVEAALESLAQSGIDGSES
jgi:hypothetical protein